MFEARDDFKFLVHNFALHFVKSVFADHFYGDGHDSLGLVGLLLLGSLELAFIDLGGGSLAKETVQIDR